MYATDASIWVGLRSFLLTVECAGLLRVVAAGGTLNRIPQRSLYWRRGYLIYWGHYLLRNWLGSPHF